MGLFGKKPKPLDGTVDPAAPFVFRVGDVFTITGKGRVFTGTVESGSVAVNAPATLLVGDRILFGKVKRLETRRDRNCLLYTSPSPRDRTRSRMPSSA